MKKTLVAVAALAASAAFAQSSVTLYGVADAYFGSEKIDGVTSQTVVNSGGLSQSRIGLSVKEDLGAGLSAFAIIEGNVALDQGAGATANRKSIVGLSGGFGAVSLGQQQTPMQDVLENVIDAQGNSAFSTVNASAAGNVAASGATLFTYGNSVRYDSPNFDGFSGAVQIGLGENKDQAVGVGPLGSLVPISNSADRGVSLNVKYENGPLGVVFAYQNDKATTDAVIPALPALPTPARELETEITALGGYYDFGVAKLNLGYVNGELTVTDLAAATSVSRKGDTINVGVTVPVDAFTFVGQYSQAEINDVAGNSKSFALEGRYALSKRTTAYAGYNNTKENIGGGADFKTNRFGVGIRHVF